MVAALPVYDQLQVVADNVDDDLGNDSSDDLLARLRRGARTFPCSKKVATKRHKPLTVGNGQGWRFVGVETIDLEFKIADGNQALVPASLQFTGHQAVFRIGGVILTLRPGRFIAGLL